MLFFYNSNELFSCFYLCYFILFYFKYFKILINYILGSKSLRLNASRLTPHLPNTKTPRLTLSPFKTWFIITTINKHCLDVNKACSSYEAKGLEKNKSLELFSWNAFLQKHPVENYVDLCNHVLHHAKGLPLALVLLGSFLFQRGKEEWESTLDRLKAIPLDDIQKVLRISYDGVDDRCKKVFLDIACFF